ncbi:MAG TPA: hypothetical protein VF669_08750 [Tepidisphaeraceae bacterium]
MIRLGRRKRGGLHHLSPKDIFNLDALNVAKASQDVAAAAHAQIAIAASAGMLATSTIAAQMESHLTA